MTPVEQNYIEQQLFQVASLPLTEENYPYGFDMQICQGGKKTNYLKVTAEQMIKIEAVLRGTI
jgi:hypothetical protein